MQLLLLLKGLKRCELDDFSVEINGPSAPSQAVLELHFLPGNGRTDGCQKDDNQSKLLMRVWAAQRSQEVIDK